MQSLNKNGVSITQTPGEEKFVKCCLGAFRGQIYFQYDYRHTRGELFSIVFDIGYDEIHPGDLAPDGSQLRPHIVWFGKTVPKIGSAIDTVEAADILLVVGTSLQVYHAAGLYRYADYDTPIYIIDPKDVLVRDCRITFIKDVTTSGMETFCQLLGHAPL